MSLHACKQSETTDGCVCVHVLATFVNKEQKERLWLAKTTKSTNVFPINVLPYKVTCAMCQWAYYTALLL